MDQPPSRTYLRPPPLLVANAIFAIVSGTALMAGLVAINLPIADPIGCVLLGTVGSFFSAVAVSQYRAVFRRNQRAAEISRGMYSFLVGFSFLSLIGQAGLVPVLILIAVTGYALAAAILNDRWAKTLQSPPKGLCRECGYDLRAHAPGQLCPECGTPIPNP